MGPLTVRERLERLSYTGESQWGLLDWIAIGVTTLGLGIPVMFVGKYLAKIVLRCNPKRG
jgi:hypothetical protein